MGPRAQVLLAVFPDLRRGLGHTKIRECCAQFGHVTWDSGHIVPVAAS